MSLNKTCIIGNVGSVENIKSVGDTSVVNFSVAVGDYSGKNTTWFRCASWGKRAEADSQYLKKGMKVYVEGQLVADPETGGPRVWAKQDGSQGSNFELRVITMEYLTSKKEMDAGAPAQPVAKPAGNPFAAGTSPFDSNTPFG